MRIYVGLTAQNTCTPVHLLNSIFKICNYICLPTECCTSGKILLQSYGVIKLNAKSGKPDFPMLGHIL